MPKDLSQNFSLRHIGPRPSEIEEMLEVLKLKDLEELVEKLFQNQFMLNLN